MTLTKDRIIEIMKNKSQISAQDAKLLVETVIESIKGKLEGITLYTPEGTGVVLIITLNTSGSTPEYLVIL